VRLGPPTTFLPVNPVVFLEVAGAGADEVRRVRDAVFVDPLERHLTWDFVPHVTLADEAVPERIAAALAALRDSTSPSTGCTCSRKGRGGRGGPSPTCPSPPPS
jgi:2'-5' RNA ligase